MELYQENMKISKHDHGIRLYPKLMLNSLKEKWGELPLFIIFYGLSSKNNMSKYLQTYQGTFLGTFLITLWMYNDWKNER
jgi:hypothetical protein